MDRRPSIILKFEKARPDNTIKWAQPKVRQDVNPDIGTKSPKPKHG